MGTFSIWHWVIVLLVVIGLFAAPRFRKPPPKRFEGHAHPVFSSVTTNGTEAEHINDRLPKWPSRVILAVTFLVLVAAVG